MKEVTNEELISKAKQAAKLKKIGDVRIGGVGSALVTKNNNVYLGVCIEACCGIGFCAEHSAISNMLTNKEYNIKRIVAVSNNGKIMSPCGRCRELIYEISGRNLDTEIILGKNKIVKLKDLLPHPW